MKKTIIWIIAAAVLLIVAFFIWRFIAQPNMHSSTTAPASGNVFSNTASSAGPTGITNIVLNRSSYEIALARAAQWEPDAALMKMNSLDTTGDSWDFTFVSSRAKNVGFEIVVDGQSVASAQEIQIAGGGIALPANLISPDQAITLVKAIPGYANATIVSLELIYNSAAKQWYWGVKTSTGATLTISATP